MRIFGKNVEGRIERLHLADAPGIAIFHGIGGIDSIDVAHNDEEIGSRHDGDPCGKRVIVTETDLIVRHGIIFIDDRHDAHFKKRLDRAPRIGEPGPVLQIRPRQKDLRTM